MAPWNNCASRYTDKIEAVIRECGSRKNNRSQTFKTHTGEIVSGERLIAALAVVADEWAQLARDIYAEDNYASHVPQSTKDSDLANMLAQAERIRQGIVQSVTIAQRLNAELTGECVALLA